MQKPQFKMDWGFCIKGLKVTYLILLTNFVNLDFWLEALFLCIVPLEDIFLRRSACEIPVPDCLWDSTQCIRTHGIMLVLRQQSPHG